MASLNDLRRVRRLLVRAKRLPYTGVVKMDVRPAVEFSLSANVHRAFPRGVHAGEHTYVASGAVVLAHDRIHGLSLHPRIGRNCFVGAHGIVMPGVQVGDGCVIGAGSVVTKDVPPGSVVAGNPARAVRSGVQVSAYGRYAEADATTSALKGSGQL